MAAAFVQQTTAREGGDLVESFPGAVTQGNLIVVTGNLTGVTDNQGNTYIQAVTQTFSNLDRASVYYAYNVASNGGTFTITVTAAHGQGWVAEEWGGFGSVDPLGGSGGVNGTSPASVTASPNATATDGCVVACASSINVGAVGFSAATPSWNNRANFGGFGVHIVSRTFTSAGTISAGLTYSLGTNTTAVIAFFEVPSSTDGDAAITIGNPDIDGTGDYTPVAISGDGSVTIRVPDISGDILVGPVGLTQMARFVVTAEDAPLARLTQMARHVVTSESTTKARLTQMTREVLYRYTCDSDEEPPPVIDYPVVHVVVEGLQPIWELERMDIEKRGEETKIASKQVSYSEEPEWPDDGQRWQLFRLDIGWRQEE